MKVTIQLFLMLILVASCNTPAEDTIVKAVAEDTAYKLARPALGGEILQTEIAYMGQPFKAAGKYNLAYELSIVSHFRSDLELLSIELFDTSRDTVPFARYGSDYFQENYHQPGVRRTSDTITLAPGRSSVMSLWHTFNEKKDIPKQLFHRLSVARERRNGTKDTLAFDVALATVPAPTSISLGLPFKAGTWLYLAETHKNSPSITEGTVSYPQRFAIDWAYLEDDGIFVRGNVQENESYPTYGLDLLAVADGVVKEVYNGVPDNLPETDELAVRITRETVCGNYIVLDIGNGISAVYAHLIPDSHTVKVGDLVTKGQVIGLLGNSGNSDGPHLHFHLETASNLTLGGEGIPYHFEEFTQLKSYSTEQLEGLFETDRLDLTDPLNENRQDEFPVGVGVLKFD